MATKKQASDPPTGEKVHVLAVGEVYSFLQSHPTTIIYAGLWANEENVSAAIRGRFMYWREPPIPLAVFDTSKLDGNFLAQLFVKQGLARLGMSLDGLGKPPQGYYLFSKTSPVRFHSGDVDLQSDQAFVAAGLFSIVAGFFSERVEFAQIGTAAITLPGAQRAADFFEEYLRNTPPETPKQQPFMPPPNATWARLQNAYKILGLLESATDEEVMAAYKALIKDNRSRSVPR